MHPPSNSDVDRAIHRERHLVRRNKNFRHLRRVGKIETVFFSQLYARNANVSVVDHNANRFEAMALAGTDKAFPSVHIKLGVVLAARDEIALLIHKLARTGVEAAALVRAVIFEPVEIIALARDEDGPGLSTPAVFIRSHQNKPRRLPVFDLKCLTYDK